MHVRTRTLDLGARYRKRGNPHRPRITESSGDPGPLAWPLGFVTVEQAGLEQDRPDLRTSRDHRALEDLAPVVVHRKPERRAIHWIVRTEGCKALADDDRTTRAVHRSQVDAQNQFVHVCM